MRTAAAASRRRCAPSWVSESQSHPRDAGRTAGGGRQFGLAARRPRPAAGGRNPGRVWARDGLFRLRGAGLAVVSQRGLLFRAPTALADAGCHLAVAGGRKRHVLLLALIIALCVYVFIRMEPYRLHRILAFVDPWNDPLNTGFQAIQSVIALGSGGFAGVGLGQSIQKYQWLPFAHTDFIFAIVGEETGLIGTTGA